jgi:hypothetical protein
MYCKNLPTSNLLPLHTLDENKMLAPHAGIAFEVPYKLGASMRVLPYQLKIICILLNDIMSLSSEMD